MACTSCPVQQGLGKPYWPSNRWLSERYRPRASSGTHAPSPRKGVRRGPGHGSGRRPAGSASFDSTCSSWCRGARPGRRNCTVCALTGPLYGPG
eukprot:1113951-Lingulodinium_polyedra.AAC.1